MNPGRKNTGAINFTFSAEHLDMLEQVLRNYNDKDHKHYKGNSEKPHLNQPLKFLIYE